MPDAPLPPGLEGACDARFAEVARLLAEQLASGAHHGVAVAVRHRGEPVVDLWGGRRGADGAESPWEADTMVVSFSTTKGPAALLLHAAMERAGVGYDAPVASVWPEFGRNGKDGVTIRQALCHEAGVPQIRDEVPGVESLADWGLVVAATEGLTPLWEPGTANGYHAINFGWIVGELLRRIDGRDVPTFLAEEVAGPLGLDGCYIGTPPEEHPRVAPLRSAPASGPTLDALPEDSLARRALSPRGDMTAFLNSAPGLSTCGPAFSGAFTARSLATLYAACERGGALDGTRLLSPETLAAAATVQNTRTDLVLAMPIYWRLGFMGGGSAVSPAGPNREAFGHAGYGGSVAFADPKAEISFAVVLDLLEVDLLAGGRTRDLVHAAVRAATAA